MKHSEHLWRAVECRHTKKIYEKDIRTESFSYRCLGKCMNTYYCHDCAAVNGTLMPPPPRETLTDNTYKLDKYLKHTLPSSSSDYKTVFTGASSESYQHYVVTAMASGHVQVDGQNRINIVWISSETTGIALQGGRFIGDMNAVKVVYQSDTNKIHGYPIAVSELSSASCAQCGKIIPY